jgi:hypothetical protein
MGYALLFRAQLRSHIRRHGRWCPAISYARVDDNTSSLPLTYCRTPCPVSRARPVSRSYSYTAPVKTVGDPQRDGWLQAQIALPRQLGGLVLSRWGRVASSVSLRIHHGSKRGFTMPGCRAIGHNSFGVYLSREFREVTTPVFSYITSPP